MEFIFILVLVHAARYHTIIRAERLVATKHEVPAPVGIVVDRHMPDADVPVATLRAGDDREVRHAECGDAKIFLPGPPERIWKMRSPSPVGITSSFGVCGIDLLRRRLRLRQPPSDHRN